LGSRRFWRGGRCIERRGSRYRRRRQGTRHTIAVEAISDPSCDDQHCDHRHHPNRIARPRGRSFDRAPSQNKLVCWVGHLALLCMSATAHDLAGPSGALRQWARRQIEQQHHAPRSAARTLQTALKHRDRKCCASGPHECFKIEPDARLALADRLHAFAPTPCTARGNTHTSVARFSEGFDH
jgi:hypothetical protein